MISGMGVSFQPGSSFEQQRAEKRERAGSERGVQEAIKVLSLRLPTVVGARPVAPPALLNSPGGGGNPDVDSMVERVLSRVFPNRSGAAVTAPMFPSGDSRSDSGSQNPSTPFRPEPRRESPAVDVAPGAPRIIVDRPPSGTLQDASGTPVSPRPNLPTTDGGHDPMLTGMVGEKPDLRSYLNWLPPAMNFRAPEA